MIDRTKIGCFLRKLRKEKNLTQEKLAEKFGVSSRSVSRWENGTSMPELGILVELADYYELNINEIIDGKRKNEFIEKEGKETLLKVADYAEAEKRLAVKRRCIATFVGTAIFASCVVVSCILFNKLPESSFLKSDSLWLGVGIMGLVILWVTVIRGNQKNSSQK